MAGWLAAVHDVGKASPAFSVQVPLLCRRMGRAGLLTHPLAGSSSARSAVCHEFVGYQAVRDWLMNTQSFGRGSAGALAAVVGSHHGVLPDNIQLQSVSCNDDLAGVGRWAEVRAELLTRATEQCGGAALLDGLRLSPLTLPSQVLLTGIVIMADWIASSDLFPLRPTAELGEPLEVDEGVAARESALRLARAWKELGLPGPWRAARLSADLDAVVAARFGIPGATSRPVQRVAVRAVAAQVRPGMIIVEAPMGEGKTEAALLAAEELASSGSRVAHVGPLTRRDRRPRSKDLTIRVQKRERFRSTHSGLK